MKEEFNLIFVPCSKCVEEYKKVGSNWMKVALVLLGFLMFLLLIETASAGFPYDDYTTKWQLCSSMNFTGENCDLWWSAFSDVPTQNVTGEQFITEHYYNRTEIDELLTQIATANYTIGINQTGNVSGYVSKSFFDNWTKEFRIGIMNNTATQQEVDNLRSLYYSDDRNDWQDFNPLWVVVGLIVVVLVGYGLKNKDKLRVQKKNRKHIEGLETDEEKEARMKLELQKLENKKKNKENKLKEQGKFNEEEKD